MSNKIQAKCNFRNKFTISYIKYLDEHLNKLFLDLEKINQRIMENEQPIIFIDGFPSKNTFQENKRLALLKARSNILRIYQFNCKEMKKAKKNLIIC